MQLLNIGIHAVNVLQASPVLTFSNQAGLDMLETTLIALQDIALEKILDDSARKVLCSEFPKIMQQVSKRVKLTLCLIPYVCIVL